MAKTDAALRELILDFGEPWSLNSLLRASYHLRNQRREMLKRQVREQMEKHGFKSNPEGTGFKGWKPMRYVVADALLKVGALRDRFELPASVKIEMDCLQECGVIASDGPESLDVGTIAQRVVKGPSRGLRLRLRELPSAPPLPTLEI